MKDSMFLCDLFLMPDAVSKINNLLNGFTLIFRDIFLNALSELLCGQIDCFFISIYQLF